MKTRSSPQKPNPSFIERPSVQVESFLDASPLAAIFSDESGMIRWFNTQAQEILGYRKEEFPTNILEVYYEKGEAEKIGEELGKHSGVLKDRLASLRSHRGERIVVRLSATTIYDAEDKRQGVIGYFEDMRSFQILETRIQLLARATLVLAQYEKLDEGLAQLAKLVIAFLPHTFCRILLLDENEEFFTVKAATVQKHLNGDLSWNPQVGISLDRASVLGSFDIQTMQGGLLFHQYNAAHQRLLGDLSSRLELHQPVYYLLRVPLELRGKLMGFLEIGEVERRPILDDERTLALAIAAQASIFVERLQQHELSKHRNLQLERLEDKLAELHPERGEESLLSQIVRLAPALVYGASAGLYTNLRNSRKIRLRCSDGPFFESSGTERPYDKSVAGEVARTKQRAIESITRSDGKTEFTIGVPLKRFGEVEYILVVTYPKGAPEFLSADIEALQLFADRASLVLGTAQALKPEHRIRGLAPLLLKLSDYIQATKDLNKIALAVLTSITAGYGLGFNRAALFLLDTHRKNLQGQMGIGHLDKKAASTDWEFQSIRKADDFDRYLQSLEEETPSITPMGTAVCGLSLPLLPNRNDLFAKTLATGQPQVASTSFPYVLPDPFTKTVAPHVDFVLVPLKARGQVLGVIFADKKFLHEAISRDEVDLLLSIANTTATAIENLQLLEESVRRAENLEKMRHAAEELAASLDSEDAMLQRIVSVAQGAFGADSTAVQFYDTHRQIFVRGAAKKDNIEDRLWEKALNIEHEWRDGAREILGRGYLSVSDMEDPAYLLLWPESVRRWISDIGARSFQCIVLAVGEEMLALLFLNYAQQRNFSEEDEESARTFGTHAAFALKKVQLLEQFRKAKSTAESIARAMTTGNLDETLGVITKGIRDALDCGTVALWRYDQDTDTMYSPPHMVGVHFPDKVKRQGSEPKGTVVWQMLDREEPYIVRDMGSDSLLKDTRFAKEEEIRSCIVIPLKVAGRKVGVLFVNYRHRRRFPADELASIHHFADQAAVAIHDAQLYYRADSRARALEALYSAGKAISDSLDTQEILKKTGEQAWNLMSHAGSHVGECDMWQVFDGAAQFVTVYPLSDKKRMERQQRINAFAPGPEKRGIIGRAIANQTAQNVGNVQDDEDYLCMREETRSELAVPIIANEQTVAIMNLESPWLDAFSSEDVRTLEALATQAGTAIHKAHQYEELEKTRVQLAGRTAVAWMGMASATWSHATRNDATTIRDLVALAHHDIEKQVPITKIQQQLDGINKLAKRVQETPITAPLSAEEGVQSVRINDFLRERIRFLQMQQSMGFESRKGVQYSLTLSIANHHTARANPHWLARAFSLIIDNALEAIEHSTMKKLTVATETVTDKVAIRISDTGKGIPEEILPHFLHEPIKKRKGTKGAGMGIILAQTILQAYGGEVSVEMTGPFGTTMIVKLPLEIPIDEHRSRISLTPGKGKVLLITDGIESDWPEVLRQALASFEMVLEVETEVEGIEQSNHGAYDMIIVDATYVDNAPLFVRQLCNQREKEKIVVVAAASEWSSARDILLAGAYDYINKSIDIRILKTMLKDILGR